MTRKVKFLEFNLTSKVAKKKLPLCASSSSTDTDIDVDVNVVRKVFVDGLLFLAYGQTRLARNEFGRAKKRATEIVFTRGSKFNKRAFIIQMAICSSYYCLFYDQVKDNPLQTPQPCLPRVVAYQLAEQTKHWLDIIQKTATRSDIKR